MGFRVGLRIRAWARVEVGIHALVGVRTGIRVGVRPDVRDRVSGGTSVLIRRRLRLWICLRFRRSRHTQFLARRRFPGQENNGDAG
ncbi:hypothetical protein C8D87_102716 [Lentzea atacamensis]|uniref:Uncharacterized protein n=1 Tax=Lentzea atacamensis TaxID=531938 RepID=A0ABX9EGK6_9PSEU|nr:hypothetical protein C8D87_102716 [Lentzea atacamensis]